MSILAWIVVGLIAGFLAKYVVRADDPGGVVGDLIVGIVGALIGGWVFNFFGHVGMSGINVYSVAVAFVGAVVLLFIIRAFTGSRAGMTGAR